MVVCSSSRSAGGDRGAQTHQHSSRDACLGGFTILLLSPLTSGTSELFQSQQGSVRRSTSPLGKAQAGKWKPCKKFPWRQCTPLHPGARLPLGCPGQGHPSTRVPGHPLPSPSEEEVDPTTCLRQRSLPGSIPLAVEERDLKKTRIFLWRGEQGRKITRFQKGGFQILHLKSHPRFRLCCWWQFIAMIFVRWI